MRKYLFILPFLMIISGCFIIHNKPSDSQIIMDIEKDMVQYNKYIKLENIKVDGIVFKKQRGYVDKIAVAKINAKINIIKDYQKPTIQDIYEGKDIPFLRGGEKIGQVITVTVYNGYYKSDRGWILGNFRGEDLHY